MVPQNIQPYEEPPQGVHRPIILNVDHVTSAEVGRCYTQSNISQLFRPSIYVTDDDAVPLTARWFVNYTFADRDSHGYVEQTYTADERGYGFVQIAPDELGLETKSPGIYAVEVVVSDGFDPDVNAAPPGRKVADGYNLATHTWVIEYRATGACPVQ